MTLPSTRYHQRGDAHRRAGAFALADDAMVGEALWATLDITDVIWNPRRPQGATSGLGIAVFPTSRGLRVTGSF